MTRRRVMKLLAAAGCVPAWGARAAGAPVVDKQARIVLGFPVGGTADSAARSLIEKLRGVYAPTVILEHKPGARGVPAAHALLSAEADGSVLYLAPNSVLTLWPHVYRSLPYDPVRDMLPVSTIAQLEFALAVGPGGPGTLREFVEWARAAPDKAMFGTLGTGSLPEFIGFGFAQAAGIRLTPVPYRGSGPGVIDLLGGQTPAWFGPLGDIAPHHKAGKARVLATTSAQRSRFLPEVPSFTEAGFPQVVAQERWGIYVRTGTDARLVERLSAVLIDAVAAPDFRQAMEQLTYTAQSATPGEFAGIIRSEHQKWGKLVADSGFRPED